METSANRLAELLRYYDITAAKLAKRTGIPKSSISMWLSGKRTMRQDKIGIISDCFKVDPGWLMGYDVPMKPNKMVFVADKRTIEDAKKNAIKAFQTTNEIRNTLDIEEASLIDTYRHLDDEGKKFIEKAIKHEQVRMRQISEASNTDATVYAARPTANPDAGDSDFIENDQADMNKEWN